MRKYTLKRDFHDSRDKNMMTFGFVTKLLLPAKVDLSVGTPVYNQGQIGSCQSNAGCSAWKYEAKKTLEPSRLFLYYNVRKDQGTINEDSGGTIRGTMKAINKYGVSQEIFDMYSEEDLYKQPNASAYTWGLRTRSKTYTRVPCTELAIKRALSNKHPIEFGMIVYESFETLNGKWDKFIIPPNSGNQLGGHALLIVGYDDTTKLFKIKNSWGSDWGDGGYFYLPYSRINELFDLWIMTV